MPSIALDLDAAQAAFARDPNVLTAWAFGSARDGEVRPGSDFDIGVWFGAKPGFDELTELLGRLEDALHFRKIDLAVLNDASAVLRFEAVSGRMLFCRDRGQCAVFVSLAAREYESAMAMIRRGLRWRAEVYEPAEDVRLRATGN
jgi:uncharacterized protein